jgi:hypothetical protein
MYLEAGALQNFKNVSRKPVVKSFGFRVEDKTASTLALLTKHVTAEYGLKQWAATYGVVNFTTKIQVKRLAKDQEYPGGKWLHVETETEWNNIRGFLETVPKTHFFNGKCSLLSKQKELSRPSP